AWEVKSTQPRLTRQRGLEADLVGRNRELATIRRKVEDLVAGTGGVVSVIAEAGLGKSRLMAEALRSVDARQVLILEGHATSVGHNQSFHPFVDLLRQWADIGEDTADPDARNRLESALTGLSADACGEMFPFIATLMGLELDGDV